MELTSKTLHEIRFGPVGAGKGYDPSEVDGFLEAVAEGIEELHERLRRAGDRAERAEQQAQTGSPASSVAEVSRVWERAAAAADTAVEGAREEAQRMRDEARVQAEEHIAKAHQDAEADRAGAQKEAQRSLDEARAEADRIAREAQDQIRAEISQLERARDQLKSDVDGLSVYLDTELGRVRGVLSDALSTLEAHATGAAVLPEVGEVDIPSSAVGDKVGAAQVTDRPEPDNWFDPGSSPTTSTDNADSEGVTDGRATQAKDLTPQGAPLDQPAPSPFGDTVFEEQVSSEQYGSQPIEQPPAQPVNDSPWGDEGGDWAPPTRSVPDNEEEGDPFLAELRRAVQDDNPLGPRPESNDPAIDSLYASDDEPDDKTGFFRRKK